MLISIEVSEKPEHLSRRISIPTYTPQNFSDQKQTGQLNVPEINLLSLNK